MKIGVIGYGMVGTAITKAFRELDHSVYVYDINIPESSLEETLDSNIIYICVPTKQNKDGSCDVSIVEEIISKLAEYEYDGTVAIKSTTQPGTTTKLQDRFKKLKLAHVPEFLRERCGYEDFTENHNVLIVGTTHKSAYLDVVNSHGHYPKTVTQVKPSESELAKYYSNSYKALRTIFSTTYGEISNHLGVDYKNVLNAFLLENVGEEEYLGYSTEFKGFGGSCLPKDVSALSSFVEKEKLNLNIFKFIIDENKKF
jgi:UDPglucose 6-dehydrogenase|tara:strand:- start:2481 stop:3248 length:768 start_codon:yes stop_codon:yes gene_type:complete